MADIFISYAREDRQWVEKLASQLQAEGFSVWWDWDLLVGKRYRETIDTELQLCKATVVVWSQHSVRSDFVRDEAEDAQQRNILLPVLKEIVRPPAGFRQIQTADLSSWLGDGAHVEFRRMMKGVSHLVGRSAAGGNGDIRVDPAHPTIHFEEQPASPPEPVSVAAPPAAIVPVPPPITTTAVRVAPLANQPVQTAASPSANPIVQPHAANPMIKYIAIGAVALLAAILVAVQFIPKSPTPPNKPPIPAILSVGGSHAGGTTPHVGPTPPAGGGATTGGTSDGGDTGQGGPQPSGGTPSGGGEPTGGGSDDGGATGDGGDIGQGRPH